MINVFEMFNEYEIHCAIVDRDYYADVVDAPNDNDNEFEQYLRDELKNYCYYGIPEKYVDVYIYEKQNQKNTVHMLHPVFDGDVQKMMVRIIDECFEVLVHHYKRNATK